MGSRADLGSIDQESARILSIAYQVAKKLNVALKIMETMASNCHKTVIKQSITVITELTVMKSCSCFLPLTIP